MEFLPYILIATLFAVGVAYWAIASVEAGDFWSIGIYSGRTPLELAPHGQIQPILTAKQVTDADALFVADPFLIRHEQRWLLFFELLNTVSARGEIAYASSADGIAWQYEKIILRERFHLSYPQVIEHDSEYFMIPETAHAGSVRLYKAQQFPDQWNFIGELLHGNFLDASVVRWNEKWWLFALQDNNHLTLHYADTLTGPWTPHALNPVVRDPALVRPGGRIIKAGSQLLRFSQDGTKTYGHHVTASEIVEMTTTSYREEIIRNGPIIGASGKGWNADGMHHIDAHQVDTDVWLAAVDGKVIRKLFRWRRGIRTVLNFLCPSRFLLKGSSEHQITQFRRPSLQAQSGEGSDGITQRPDSPG